MNTLFEKYVKAKDKLTLNYDGYQLEKIIAVELIALIYGKQQFTWRNLINLFSTKKITIPQNQSRLYSIGDYNRQDYYNLLSYVRNSDKKESDLIDLSLIKKSRTFNIKNIITSFKHVFKADIKLSFLSKVSLSCSMTYSLNTIELLEKNETNQVEYFCSFCSHLSGEAELDYYFQKRNVHTYTLQHGLWFVFDKPPIDAIAYDNVIANSLLCWGEYTRDEFIKYGIHKHRLIVAGYPREHEALKPATELAISKLKVLVLFSRKLFHTNNLSLIKLLSQASTDLSLDIHFKLHPSLPLVEYQQLATQHGFQMAPLGGISELICSEMYDCTISYNSTAYYDSYISNCISLSYQDVQADNSLAVSDDRFSCTQELVSLLQNIKQKNVDENFWQDTELKLEYILGFGINKYGVI
jgi:hypothetical protein